MPRPILVFDSGVGGLSVFSHIRQCLPMDDYCYLFDNKHLPYGELPESKLIELCSRIIVDTVSAVDAAIVVVACNTASTVVLPKLRSLLDIPVVGVVPAIKPAAKYSKIKQIGLLATPGTIQRDYTNDLIASFSLDCTVHRFASSVLVGMAESKAAGNPIDIEQLEKELKPIVDSGIDVLVLGCTHFPLLQQEIQQVLGNKVKLVDSGKAIAKRVVSLLKEERATDEMQTTGLSGLAGRISESDIRLNAIYTSEVLDSGVKKTLATYGFDQVASCKAITN